MRNTIAVLCLILGGFGCRMEAPDPASEALAILSKRPATFVDRMISMEALVARHFPAPDRILDIPDTLAGWRQKLLTEGFAAETDSGKAGSLVRFFFEVVGIAAVDSGDSLNLSLPGWVLFHRRGSCVGIAALFLAFSEVMGIPARTVPLPGHLFIRIRSHPGSWRSVEPLRGGIARSDSFYRETFRLASRPWYDLASRPPEFALEALLFNMANAHRSAGLTDFALSEFRNLSVMIPGFPDALGAEGALRLARGEILRARELASASLAGDSLSLPAQELHAATLENPK